MAHVHQRKIKNYLINPAFQFKFTLYFLVSGTAIIGFLISAIYMRLAQAQEVLNQPNIDATYMLMEINRIMVEMTSFTVASFVGFATIAFIYSIIISHRIAGPMYAIVRYIEEIRAGKYDPTKKLRKYDELQPIMNSLNELASALKNKH